MYFSEELKAAEKLGYSYKILRGYIFKKENIFKDFVLDLYQLKENSEYGSPNYIISKMIMNSVFGRLGMIPEMEKHLILLHEESEKFHSNANYIVTDTIDLKMVKN